MKHPPLVGLDHLSEFTQIIDVRTPAEFALDHIPGAINCPVLSNEERVVVGTLYKQVSIFQAKKVGAAMVARNVAHHLDTAFANHDKTWRPLVVCWRGGNRSGAMTHILRQVGWGASQLQGGYKAFRQRVLEDLAQWPSRFKFRVICGETGSAKSALLQRLAALGAQVLDLEHLAAHKGSVLGLLMDRAQPSQKMFDSTVWQALSGFDPQRPVYVEAESKKIGLLRVPEAVFEQMTRHGEVIRVQAEVPARVEFLLRDYAYFLSNPAQLKTQLAFLKDLHGHEQIRQWHALVDAGQWEALVTDLLTRHYDRAYRKSTPQWLAGYSAAHCLPIQSLDDNSLNAAALSLLGQQAL